MQLDPHNGMSIALAVVRAQMRAELMATQSWLQDEVAELRRELAAFHVNFALRLIASSASVCHPASLIFTRAASVILPSVTMRSPVRLKRRNHDRSYENHLVFRTCAYRVAFRQRHASGATQREQPRAPCAIWPAHPPASSGWPSIRRGTGGWLPSDAGASQAASEGRFLGKAITSALAPCSKVSSALT